MAKRTWEQSPVDVDFQADGSVAGNSNREIRDEESGFHCNNAGTPASSERVVFVDYLFRRYRQPLVHYVKGLVGSQALADEIIQEAYIRMLQAKKLDSLESRARGYLFKTATNLVRDQHRYDCSRSRAGHVSIDDVCLTDDRAEFEQTAERDMDLEKVKQCLLELPARCRKAFILHAFEQMSLKEIAVALDVSTKTVERDLAMAFELCRSRLGD